MTIIMMIKINNNNNNNNNKKTSKCNDNRNEIQTRIATFLFTFCHGTLAVREDLMTFLFWRELGPT